MRKLCKHPTCQLFVRPGSDYCAGHHQKARPPKPQRPGTRPHVLRVTDPTHSTAAGRIASVTLPAEPFPLEDIT